MDPLTREFPWYTPYQFAGNKPIIAIDLDGLEEEVIIGEVGKKTGTEVVKRTSVEIGKMTWDDAMKMVSGSSKVGGRFLGAAFGTVLNLFIPTDAGESAQFASLLNYEKHRFKELSNKPYTNLSESERRELNNLYSKYELNSDGDILLKPLNLKIGLPNYENPGHHDPFSQNYNRSKSVLPENHRDLWGKSKEGKDGNRWTKLGNGKKAVYHRFQDDGNGNWQWNGSTEGKTKDGIDRVIRINNVPIEIQRNEK